jgi:transposase
LSQNSYVVHRLAASSRARTPSRRADTSHARALTTYLGKLYGRLPYSRTAEFFNRDGASNARDVLALDQSLRDSKELQRRIDNLARRLIS